MKQCPVCQLPMNQTLLERNLPAHQCTQCGGLWISANEYFAWLPPGPAISDSEIDIEQALTVPYPILDNNKAIVCPDCGHILRRFQVWPNVNLHLERCSTCNGVWLDRNEWDALHVQNLHEKLNLFFTHSWQERLRGEEMRSRFAARYEQLFGAEDYARIREIRAWLAQHPQGDRLLAYLTDRHPYHG